MGSLVVGRFLTPELSEKIDRASSLHVTFHPVFNRDLPDSIQRAIMLLTRSPDSSITLHSPDSIFTRKLLLDVTGIPVALIEVRAKRTIWAIGVNAVNTTLIAMAVTIFLLIFFAWLFLNKLVIHPTVTLKTHISRIRQSHDLSSFSLTERKDEIGALANEFEMLLGELAQTQTDLREARDRALQTADEKGKFLANMSHEIRTPMHGVLGMTDLLNRTDLDPIQRAIVQNIQNSGTHLLDVINDILDFSKIESGKLHLRPEEFNLRDSLEETADLMAIQAHAKNLDLLRTFPVAIDQRLIGDRECIRRILVNLIGNAIKFTEEGEVGIRVTVSKEHADRTNIRVEISDTGIGITQEQQEAIFEEFSQADDGSTRKYGGSGLGLTISKKLLGMMDSDLGLDSEPGRGSCFWFKLSLQSAEEPLPAAQPQDVLQGLHGLIVDDDDTRLNILRSQLSSYGMTNGWADNGTNALTALKNAIADGKPYDLALLHWDMEGMNGMEIARLIRADETFAELPMVIFSSAQTGDERLVSGEIYIDKYLIQPVSESCLYGNLVEMMRKRQMNVKQAPPGALDTKPTDFDSDVLLVEDNRINQEVGRLMLEKIGCRVTIAENGVAALAVLDTQQFDLIFMDCHMPEMDGFEATIKIRSEEAESRTRTPIIALTADVIEGVREKCLDAGMDDYITKPFSES